MNKVCSTSKATSRQRPQPIQADKLLAMQQWLDLSQKERSQHNRILSSAGSRNSEAQVQLSDLIEFTE